MKEFKFIKLLDKFKWIYEKFDVDYEKMKLILKLKLTMDERRVPTIMQNNNGKDKDKNKFFMSLFFYMFMGLFIGILTFLPINKMYVYTMVFAIFMFIILTVFISDFSTVLLDVRDKNLIATRGVNNRTINAAKITHICYYVFLISLSLGWLAIIGSFKAGILIGILFLLEIFIIDIFMIVITSLLYFIILKFFNGEKVKDIINFVQIMLTIVMSIGYQFISRIFALVDLNVIYKAKIWHLLFPPMWFSAPIYLIEGGSISMITASLTISAFLIPIVAIIIYIKQSSNFELYLSKLNSNDTKEKEKRRSIFFKLGRLFCRSNTEKAYYTLTNSIMKKEREFKLKVYPSLGFTIVFPVLFIFLFTQNNNFSSFSEWQNNIVNSKTYLNIYFFALMIPTIMIMLQYSQCYKAAWIFKSTPLTNEGDIYKGCYKAFLFTMLLPIYLFESILFIICFKTNVIIHLIITLLFIIALIPIFYRLNKFSMPFTQQFNVSDRSSNLVNMLLCFGVVGLGILIHSFLGKKIMLLIIYGIILVCLDFILWSKVNFKNLKLSK
ncbi:ABC transporter permease [Clostridium sp.]|uniref:ABC transporter permease n=1 Tax=Clostridium sp. TaxID=1506 RepID=UPI002617CD7B|nr:ABC transporter permease [Clostridium sp.]